MKKNGYRHALEELLRNAGWEIAHHGKHDVFKHPDRPKSLTVPSKLNDRYLGNRLLRIAGIDKRLG